MGIPAPRGLFGKETLQRMDVWVSCVKISNELAGVMQNLMALTTGALHDHGKGLYSVIVISSNLLIIIYYFHISFNTTQYLFVKSRYYELLGRW